jgi:hypothetical protein
VGGSSLALGCMHTVCRYVAECATRNKWSTTLWFQLVTVGLRTHAHEPVWALAGPWPDPRLPMPRQPRYTLRAMGSPRSHGALTVRTGPEATSVEIRWRGGRAGALAWYGLMFMGVLLYVAMGEGQFESVHRMLMVIGAVVIGYFVLAHLLNATCLAVSDSVLSVTHGPMPGFGRITLPVKDVSRLSFDEKTARLQLHTKLGEELTVLDGLLPDKVSGLRDALHGALRGTPTATPVEQADA